MEHQQRYRVCLLRWQEPALTTEPWTIYITSAQRKIPGGMGVGVVAVAGPTRGQAVDRARLFVDRVIVSRHAAS